LLSDFGSLGLATWLDPSAGFLIFLLKLCFRILAAFPQEPRASRKSAGEPDAGKKDSCKVAK
jgi:hypothetical protein